VTATNNKTVEKLSSQAQVRINVVAANNPPFFQQRSYLATVRDDQDVGSVVINNIRVFFPFHQQQNEGTERRCIGTARKW